MLVHEHAARTRRTTAALLFGLALLQPARWLADAQTCKEWNCTDPAYHIVWRNKNLPTVYPLEQVGGGPVYVNGTATNATTNISFVPTVPEITDACEAKELFDPVDCICGCRAANRMVIYTLAYLVVAYSIIIGFFATVIKKLRTPHRAAYTALRQERGLPVDPVLTQSTFEWMTKSRDDVRHDCGLDAAVYLLHCEQCSKYWLTQFFICGLFMTLTYRYQGDYEQGWTIFAWSYGNIAPNNPIRWIPALAQVWFAVSTVWFAKRKQKAMDAYKLEAEVEGNRHTSTTTVWIQNVAPTAREEDLVSWFDRNYRDQVDTDENGARRAKLAWDVNALGHNVRNRRRYIKKVNALSKSLAEDPHTPGKNKVDAQMHKLVSKIDELAHWEAPLRNRGLRTGGSAFVTFQEDKYCLNFRRTLAEQKSSAATAESVALGVENWTATLAPRPAEVYWENFGLGENEKMANQAKAIFYTFAMFFMFVCIALCIMWTIGFLYFDILYGIYPRQSIGETVDSQYEVVGGVVWYGFGGICAVTFLALEEEMSPIVKFICKFESPYTKSHKQSSYLGKMYWFYVIYHVALTTLLFGQLVAWCEVKDVPVTPGPNTGTQTMRNGRHQVYMEAVGLFHQNRLFLTSCVIDMLHVMEGFTFFTRKAVQLTAEEEAMFTGAEDEEDENDDHHNAEDMYFDCKFDYTRNYGESIAVMTSISCYATMHPTMMFFGSVYFGIKYFVDKYQITNQYSKPHVQYGRRARTTTIYILWSQVCAQFMNAIWFLIVTPDMMDVGLFCLASALGMLTVTSVYVYQPEALKLAKTTTRGQEKLVRLDSIHELQAEHEQAAGTPRPSKAKDTTTNVYNPPRPDDLHVGVELRSHWTHSSESSMSTSPERMQSMDGAAPPGSRPVVPVRPPGHVTNPVWMDGSPPPGAGGGAEPPMYNPSPGGPPGVTGHAQFQPPPFPDGNGWSSNA